MRKIILITVLIMAYSASLYSQSIHGIVKNSNDSVVSYATVTLLEGQDSAFVAGCVTQDDGTFSFNTYSQGRLLKISCVGYESVIIPATDNVTVRL